MKVLGSTWRRRQTFHMGRGKYHPGNHEWCAIGFILRRRNFGDNNTSKRMPMGEFLGPGIGAHALEGSVLITWTTALSKAMGTDLQLLVNPEVCHCVG